MDVNLNIDTLSLQGFPSADRVQIAAAVQQELTRLLAERGVPPSLARGHINLDGGRFEFAAGTSAKTVGCQIAQQIYGSLS